MERSRDHRRRDLPGPCASVVGDTTEDERECVHGVFERKEQSFDISEIWEHEVCLSKQRVLVQRVLCRYSREEHEGNQGIYSESAESG